MEKLVHALNDRILSLTMRIRETYPELSKYIEEMPVSIPNEPDPHVQAKQLQVYYDSLKNILNKYAEGHGWDLE
ncbi:MAG: hypothetical protein I8H66_02440 [Sphingobacteriia bacterium]|nr:hypothetical protein [Sphingobacteriia bacterium]